MSTQNPPTMSELLTHTTTRMRGQLSDNELSVGTGFFFKFKIDEKLIPVIITNKHVVENCLSLEFTINAADQNNNRVNFEHLNCKINEDILKKTLVLHSEKEIDLCAIPIANILNQFENENKKYYIKLLDDSLIPSETDLQTYTAIEDVTMIGYPNGIWDETNNLPVARRGATATHPKVNYNGKHEFLVDIAVFPGSSGSPIFLFNQGSYSTPRGITMGSRLKLLGINYAVYTHGVEGEIIMKKTPTTVKRIAESNIPNNLGIIIKSNKILDLESNLRSLLK